MAQTIIVIGTPHLCGEPFCEQPATVILRQENEDGSVDVINYCDDCWLATRRGYNPLVSRDEQSAVRAAEQIVKPT